MNDAFFKRAATTLGLAVGFAFCAYLSVVVSIWVSVAAGWRSHSALTAIIPFAPCAAYGVFVWAWVKGASNWRVLNAVLVPAPSVLFLWLATEVDSASLLASYVFGIGFSALLQGFAR